MTAPSNKPAWCQHPVIFGLLCGASTFIAVTIFLAIIPPAWAVSIPVGNLFVIELGDMPGLVAAFILLMTWWEARRAKKISLANSADIGKVKEDVKLIERNTNSLTTQLKAAAREEGERKGVEAGKKAGVETAATLAEGQRQGAAHERASVAAANPAPPVAEPHAVPDGNGKKPLPVSDERTAGAAERSADALERTAVATEKDKK